MGSTQPPSPARPSFHRLPSSAPQSACLSALGSYCPSGLDLILCLAHRRSSPACSAAKARRLPSSVFGPVLAPPCIRHRRAKAPSGRLHTGALHA